MGALTFSEVLVAVLAANGVTLLAVVGYFRLRKNEKDLGGAGLWLAAMLIICLAGIASVQAGG